MNAERNVYLGFISGKRAAIYAFERFGPKSSLMRRVESLVSLS